MTSPLSPRSLGKAQATQSFLRILPQKGGFGQALVSRRTRGQHPTGQGLHGWWRPVTCLPPGNLPLPQACPCLNQLLIPFRGISSPEGSCGTWCQSQGSGVLAVGGGACDHLHPFTEEEVKELGRCQGH